MTLIRVLRNHTSVTVQTKSRVWVKPRAESYTMLTYSETSVFWIRNTNLSRHFAFVLFPVWKVHLPHTHPSQLKKSCLFHMLHMKSLLRREAHTLTYSAESESEEATMASSPSTNRSGWWHSMRCSICQACTKPWVQASISLREKKKKAPQTQKTKYWSKYTFQWLPRRVQPSW